MTVINLQGHLVNFAADLILLHFCSCEDVCILLKALYKYGFLFASEFQFLSREQRLNLSVHF